MELKKIQPLYDAFTEYAKVYTNLGADYSVTDLLKSPQQVQLFKRYSSVIKREVDILGQLAAFRGTAIHEQFRKMLYKVITKQQSDDYLVEKRLWDRINGRKISGQIDCLHKNTLYDFKTTSVWKKIFGDTVEWEQQLNLYSYMLALIGVQVKDIHVIAWYQDWNKMQQYNNTQYPSQVMEVINLPLWTAKEQQEYITNRIEIHKAAELLSDTGLPECTNEEMWVKEDTWAVYKVDKKKDSAKSIGRKKASRVLKSKTEAEKWIGTKENFTIVHRPGERTRCENWCLVAPFCFQHKAYMENR